MFISIHIEMVHTINCLTCVLRSIGSSAIRSMANLSLNVAAACASRWFVLVDEGRVGGRLWRLNLAASGAISSLPCCRDSCSLSLREFRHVWYTLERLHTSEANGHCPEGGKYCIMWYSWASTLLTAPNTCCSILVCVSRSSLLSLISSLISLICVMAKSTLKCTLRLVKELVCGRLSSGSELVLDVGDLKSQLTPLYKCMQLTIEVNTVNSIKQLHLITCL